MKTKILILLILSYAGLAFGQNPTYQMILKNDSLLSNAAYEFDIYILQTGSVPLELATISPIMTFNTAISSGSLTFTINAGSSELSSSQQPTSLSIVGDELQVAPRTPPGAGSGSIIPTSPGLRVGRFRLTSSVPFLDQKGDVTWKNSGGLPTTKVNAYDSSDLNVNITDSTGHLNQLANQTLSPLGISTPSTLKPGIPGALYADTLAGFNGTLPYTWSLSSGSLPDGLSLSAAGIITGTPTALGISNFTLLLTDGVSSSVSKGFSISVAPGSLSNFLVEKSTGGDIGTQTAGGPFQITITARDAYGNAVTSFGGTAELISNVTIQSGGGTTPNFVAGVLSSHSLSLTTAGGGATLTATRSGGSETGISNSFTVNPASPSRLVIQSQPSSAATAGISFALQPVIQVEDNFGNIVTTDNSTVVTASSQGGTGTLQGSLSATAANGVASYADLSYDIAEMISVNFSSGLLLPAGSDPITVGHGAAAKVRVETAPDGAGTIVPSQNLTAGSSLTAYSIERDLFDNFISNVSSAWSLSGISGGILQSDLAPATDNKSAVFTPQLLGSAKIQASVAGLDSITSDLLTVINSAPDHLVFSQQPSSSTAGAAISPATAVQLKDIFGNNVSTSGIVITISLSSGAGTLSGTKSRITDATGLTTFNDLSVDTAGLKTLGASSSGLTGATSDPFSIVPDTPDRIVFVQQPTNTLAGAGISPPVTTQLIDQFGNNAPAPGISVSLEVSSGTDTLHGVKTSTTDANGIATFSGLTILISGVKNISASGSGLTGATSLAFNILPAAAASIGVETMADGGGSVVSSQTIISGSSITAYSIARDIYGNFVSNSSGTWSLDNVTGSVIGTDLVPFDGNRAATFTGHGAGSASIKSASGLLAPVPSGTITVVAGTVKRLVFVRQPTSAIAGIAITPSVTVQLKDSLGNDVSVPNIAVTLALSSGTGILSGTLTILTASNGLASFSGLSVNKTGTKTLSAQSGSLDPALSDAFQITAGTAVAIAFLGQPPASATAGLPLSPAVTVQLRDSYDNTVPSAGETVTLTLSSGTGPLMGTTSIVTDASGTATFSDLSLQKTGLKQLTATRTLFAPVASSSFTINPAAASKIVVETAPDGFGSAVPAQPLVSGSNLVAFSVLRDQYDNFVANDSSATWSLAATSDSVKQSDLAYSAACNCATFTPRLTGSAQIHAERSGLTSVNSGTLTVLAGPPSMLRYLQQPSGAVAGAVITPAVQIQITDDAGNPIPLAGEIVTMTKKTGTGTLSGTLARTTNSSGTATFNDLSVDLPGIKSLEASHNTYPAVTSDPFTLSQYTITATSGPNGSISPSGIVSVNYGASQSFFITPDPGHHIFDVSVDGSSAGRVSSYTFTNIAANHTIGASFAVDTLTITSSAGPNGSISPEGVVRVLFGGSQSFNFTPASGYHLFNFTVDGVQYPPAPSYTFTNVTLNHTISASFVADSVTITASAGPNGIIVPSGSVRVGYGLNQTFSMVPGIGYHLSALTVDGTPAAISPSYTFTNVTADHSINAQFAIDTLTITASASANGSISPSGAVKVLFGSDQLFSISPAAGYHVTSLLVDGIPSGTPSSYNFTNVRANHSIAVSFGINTYTITATSGAHGTISPAGTVIKNYGSNQSFTITPDLGYHLSTVNVDGSPVSVDSTNVYTFTAIAADHTIDAAFAPNSITINVSTSPAGLAFYVDGVPYTSSQIFTWVAGESHTVSTDSIQPSTAGNRYAWSSWSNAPAMMSVVAPLVNTSYTASFTSQHYLTMVANEGGTVTPPSGWFNHAQIVRITGIPDADYSFNIWSATIGGYSGRTNPADITINLPITETASFTRNPVAVTVQTSPPGRSFSYDGTTYLVKQTFTEQPGTSHTIRIANTTQPGAAGVQYLWRDWSDGGAATHTVFPMSDTTFTASFTTQFYLTMAAGTGGTVSPASSWQDSGSAIMIKAIPSTGYIFKGWSGSGSGSYTGTLDSTLITIGSPASQTASFALDTLVITATAGLHGAISPSGGVKVVYGSSQSFTIIPDTLYNISDVVVDGVSVGAVTAYTFTNVTIPHSIVASFTINGYTITASAGPHGKIDPSGPVPADYGSAQSFTITPDTGYYIDSVYVDGSHIGAPAEYLFENITSNHTITARFAPNQLMITASAGPNGAISPSGEVQVSYGSSATFFFIPDSGYHVDSVFVDGAYAGAPANYTFAGLNANHTISALFAINLYTVTATGGLNGTVNPGGVTTVSYGDSLAVYVTPDTGYHVASVLVDGLNVGAVDSYTFREIRANHTITAAFGINFYSIVSSAGPNGTIAPLGISTLPYGSTQRYSIRPNSNYHVDSIIVDGTFAGTDTSYTFPEISSNHTVRATFAINLMTVSLNTVPESLSVVVDNVTYRAPAIFSWAYGSSHSISVIDSQNVSVDTRYLFSSWSDLGAERHQVVVTRDTLFTASFRPQYYLTVSALSGGSATPPSSWQDSGKTVSIRGIPSQGYQFDRWIGTGPGSYSDSSNPFIISMLGPVSQTATFKTYLAGINLITSPAGLSIIVDDTLYQSPHAFYWATGTTHTIAAIDTQMGAPGIRYVWSLWSDNGAKSHQIVPISDTTLTAAFITQYYLTMTANTGGTVTPASGWFNRSQNVTITAFPSLGYNFTTWAGLGSGSYSGATNPSSVTMNAPITETANFTRKPVQVTIGTDPAGRSFIYNGTTYTATQTRFVDPGAQLTLGAQSPQPDILADKQWAWTGWSDSGAQAHTVFPNSDSAFTAFFAPQYALTMNVQPPGSGTTSPSGKKYYFIGDTVTLSAIPATGYAFTGWSGGITGAGNPARMVISGPVSVTANFGVAVQISLNSIPPGRRIMVDDSIYTTPKNVSWLRGSSHTLAPLTPQSDAEGTRYVFTHWNGLGDTVNTVAPLTDTLYVASFTTQHYLTMSSDAGGLAEPQSGWHNERDTVTIRTTVAEDYAFYAWIGTGTGSYSGPLNPSKVIMLGPIKEHAIFSFSIPPPTLAGIPDGSVDISTAPFYRWRAYPGASSYNIQVSSDSAFADTSKIVLNQRKITDTLIQSPALANARKYFWRVSVRSGIDESRFSDPWEFTTVGATIAVATPPAAWATTFTYPVYWTSSLTLTGNVNLLLSADSGRSFRLIKENIVNSGVTTVIIPDTVATRPVDSCRLRIESYMNGEIAGESDIFSIVSGILPASVRLSATIPFAPQPLVSTEYRLLSLPGVVDTMKVGIYPFGVPRVDWRMFSDNGYAENYLVELSINSYLRTGEGYWLLKKGEFYLPQFDMVMPALSPDASHSISVHSGWNIVGNPFDKTVAWQTVLEANSLPTTTKLYAYNSAYQEQLAMEPFKGYYFFNSSNLTSLRIPYPFGNPSIVRKTVPTLWKVKLEFESDINKDGENYIGISSIARQGIDMLDGRKPPLFQDQGFLYFPRPEWDETFQRFNSDFRPEIGEGQTWDFEISNPRKSSGRIRFDGIEEIPAEYRVVLINLWNSSPVDLRNHPEYAFVSVIEKMQFKIIVGSQEYVDREVTNLRPKELELVQNFPNPFNSSTSISVKLPRDSRITLNIYNSIGQMVKTAADGQFQAGTHTFLWDGTDLSGAVASTGVYFYRLIEGATTVQTMKMIMIK